MTHTTTDKKAQAPDPELAQHAKRRNFTAKYKLDMLA